MRHFTVNGKPIYDEMRKHYKIENKENHVNEFMKSESLSEFFKISDTNYPNFNQRTNSSNETLLSTILKKEGMTYEDMYEENKNKNCASIVNKEIYELMKNDINVEKQKSEPESWFHFGKDDNQEVKDYIASSPKAKANYQNKIEDYFEKSGQLLSSSAFRKSELETHLEKSHYLYRVMKPEIDSIKNPNYQAIDKFMDDTLKNKEINQGCHNEFLTKSEKDRINSDFKEMYSKFELKQKLETNLVKEQPVIKKTMRQREQEDSYAMKI